MRVGSFSGALAVGAASLALARPLRLHEGFAIPGTAGATVVGLTLGTGNGMLLAGLLDPSGSFELVPDRQAVGGIVFGQALGATTGFLWTRFFQPDGADGAAAITGSAFGASLGFGLALLASDPVARRPGDPQVDGPHGRLETAATLGGSLLGLGAAGLVQRYSPLTGPTSARWCWGRRSAGCSGGWRPRWTSRCWTARSSGRSKGGLLAGIGGGGLGAIALRRATGRARIDGGPGRPGWRARIADRLGRRAVARRRRGRQPGPADRGHRRRGGRAGAWARGCGRTWTSSGGTRR